MNFSRLASLEKIVVDGLQTNAIMAQYGGARNPASSIWREKGRPHGPEKKRSAAGAGQAKNRQHCHQPSSPSKPSENYIGDRLIGRTSNNIWECCIWLQPPTIIFYLTLQTPTRSLNFACTCAAVHVISLSFNNYN
tara:strand:- start:638 stop:1045 length:408 start_codon:yes stop_codon:yes gene_type:complete